MADVLEPGEFIDEMPPIRSIADYAALIVADLQLAAKISAHTESQIETMMGAALIIYGPYLQLIRYDENWPDGWLLIPQMPLLWYRADWAIIRPDRKIAVVECDGREFHTSEEAIAHDRKRDDEMNAIGVRVYRFTGSEIYRNAAQCAKKVISEFCQ